MKNLTPFLIFCFNIIVENIKTTMKIIVQSSNSNPVATDDSNITTIFGFLNCTTGVSMIDDTGESTDDLLVEVIATSVKIKGLKHVIQEATHGQKQTTLKYYLLHS